MSERDEAKFWTACTKCGHCESSEIILSRFCPRCNYMRGVRKVGETEDQGKLRDAAPFTNEERDRLCDRLGWPRFPYLKDQ